MYGFSVMLLLDATKAQVLKTAIEIGLPHSSCIRVVVGCGRSDEDLVLFYFCGYGMEVMGVIHADALPRRYRSGVTPNTAGHYMSLQAPRSKRYAWVRA